MDNYPTITNPETRNAKLRILLIEDNPVDARLLRAILAEATHTPFDLIHVDRLATGLGRLKIEKFDVVLLDLSLPDSQGLDTVIQTQTQAPHMPMVLLTGLDDEEVAVQAVQKGAQDYLVKGHVDCNLLIRSIRYAIERQRLRIELEGKVKELQEAINQIRQLQKLLPICSYCKKIRDEEDHWQKLENFITERAGARFTHHICPDCYEAVVKPELQKLTQTPK